MTDLVKSIKSATADSLKCAQDAETKFGKVQMGTVTHYSILLTHTVNTYIHTTTYRGQLVF